MSKKYDVFISYNTKDTAYVTRLRDEFDRFGVRTWIDFKNISPGDNGLQKIEEGLDQSRVILVVLGGEGFGAYQSEERYVAVMQAIENKVRVIPMLIPGYDQGAKKPSFLLTHSWVEFPGEVTDREPFARLMMGLFTDCDDDERYAAFKKGTAPKPAVADTPERRRVDDAIREQVAAVKRPGSLTVFVGAGAGDPRPYEIARSLLFDLDFIDGTHHDLLPSMEVAGSYYEIDRGTSSLESRVVQIIQDATEFQQPRLHALIADLVHRLRTFGSANPRRRQQVEAPLLVTTAIDLMLERALLRAGVPFTRIVQNWSGDMLSVNEYPDVMRVGDDITVGTGRDAFTFPASDTSQLDEAIMSVGSSTVRADDRSRGTDTHPILDMSFSRFQQDDQPLRPILYKYHGSQDVASSCALSTEQYFMLADLRAIPNKIVEMIGNSSAIFFPGGGLDADVRHAYQTLLKRAYKKGRAGLPRHAIVPPLRDPEPDTNRRLEMRMWSRVVEAVQKQMQISILESNAETFLTDLIERLPA